MATAVDTPSHPNNAGLGGHGSRDSRIGAKFNLKSLKIRQKLFGSNNKAQDIADDVVKGAEGGPPPSGAAPVPEVEERDPIQHVGGTGIVANDPNPTATNRDTHAEDYAAHATNPEKYGKGGNSGAVAEDDTDPNRITGSSASDKALGKRRDDSYPAFATTANAQDPTAGAGGLSSFTRRSSIQIAEDNDDAKNGDHGEVQEIGFFHRDAPYFWLSNSSDHPVYLDNIRYPTAEHLFQATKFLPHKPDIAQKIRKQSSPLDAIHEARKHSANIKRGWIGQALNTQSMRTVLILKFTQHTQLQQRLLQTGDVDLFEDSPTDAFWGRSTGTAGAGAGRNELGKALMHTRETLRSQAGLGVGSAAKTV